MSAENKSVLTRFATVQSLYAPLITSPDKIAPGKNGPENWSTHQ